MSSRVGVFGGTFDPVHVGHLVVAQEVHDALNLDVVLWMPAALPPHRREEAVTAGEIRYEMIRAAVGDDARFEVSRLELDRPGPSFTVDTLEALREREPAAELFLVLGADQVTRLRGWRRPERILELATVVAVGRNGTTATSMDVPHEWVEIPRLDVSASSIRNRVAAGRPIRFLAPDPVCRIIEREALYQ